MAGTIYGIGRTYWGARDKHPDGSFVTTEWFIFLGLPVYPIRALRIWFVEKTCSWGICSRHYLIKGEEPLDLGNVLLTYFVTYLSVAVGIALFIASWTPRFFLLGGPLVGLVGLIAPYFIVHWLFLGAAELGLTKRGQQRTASFSMMRNKWKATSSFYKWFLVAVGIVGLVVLFYSGGSTEGQQGLSEAQYYPTNTQVIGGRQESGLSGTEKASATPVVVAGCVTADKLNVRAGPGTTYQVVGYLSRDDCVIFVEKNTDGSWVRFSTGWVSARYISATGSTVSISDLPVSRSYKSPSGNAQPSGNVQRAVCACSSNIYDCKDFPSQEAAQACYQYCLSVTGEDVHWLDDDGDGIACEYNP